jgi:TolA-binding protein
MSSPSTPLLGDEHDKLVRIITEQITTQLKAELTALRTRVSQLENKVEIETNKRIQLEEEVRKLKGKTDPQQATQAKKSFLRGSYTDLPDKRNNLESNGDNGTHLGRTRTHSDETKKENGNPENHKNSQPNNNTQHTNNTSTHPSSEEIRPTNLKV